MLTIILPSYKEPKAHDTLRKCKAEFPDAQVIISPDDTGRGKGWAVKKGVMAANGDVIALLDGDGDIHPRMLKRLLPFLEDWDIVVGSKNYTGMRFNRKIITLLSRTYIKVMFGLDFTTQTGIKVMRSNVLPYWESNGFMFDLEFLTKAYRSGYTIIEIPVIAKSTKSKSLEVIWASFLDSIKIWFRLLSL